MRMSVEPRQPVGQPAGTGLEERDAQRRMALERAEQHQAPHRRHLLHRVAHRVAQGEGLGALATDGRSHHAEPLVDREGQAMLLEHVVQGVVRRVAEVPAVQRIRPDHDARKPELGRVRRLRPPRARSPPSGRARPRPTGSDPSRSTRPSSRCTPDRRMPTRSGSATAGTERTTRWTGRGRHGRCPRGPCTAGMRPRSIRRRGSRPTPRDHRTGSSGWWRGDR